MYYSQKMAYVRYRVEQNRINFWILEGSYLRVEERTIHKSWKFDRVRVEQFTFFKNEIERHPVSVKILFALHSSSAVPKISIVAGNVAVFD